MKLLLLSLLFCSFIFSPIFSQDIEIDLGLFNNQARIFYVGDLDPTGLGVAPNYFFLELFNPSPSEVTARIEFKLITNDIPLVEAETENFRLPRNIRYSFTNNDLNKGFAMIGDQEIRLKNYRVDFDRLEGYGKRIARTGKLPAGIYTFWAELVVIQPTPDRILDLINNHTLTISNPTTIELLYPGMSGEIMEIPTTTPYFIWQSDAEFFNFYLYRQYESGSIQDVLSRDPVLKLLTYPFQFLQYQPESQPIFYTGPNEEIIKVSEGAIRQIIPGSIYLWYVEAIIPTASGEPVLISSDVYQFKVVDRETSAMNANLIKAYLRQILGERHDDYMRDLTQYDPTGVIIINGEQVEVEALVDLIEDLLSGKIVIENVIVEN